MDSIYRAFYENKTMIQVDLLAVDYSKYYEYK
jgi:hypothetical protein